MHSDKNIYVILVTAADFCYSYVTVIHTHAQLFHGSGFCPGQPGWAGTRRNIHPLTSIFVISHTLSASSIYFDPRYPLCSTYIPDSLLPQSVSKFSLVYLLAWHPQLHTSYISSPNHCLLFAAHAHTIATCFAVEQSLHGPFDNPHVTCAVSIIIFVIDCQCSFTSRYFHSAAATLSLTMLCYSSHLFLLELLYMHSWFKLLHVIFLLSITNNLCFGTHSSFGTTLMLLFNGLINLKYKWNSNTVM